MVAPRASRAISPMAPKAVADAAAASQNPRPVVRSPIRDRTSTKAATLFATFAIAAAASGQQPADLRRDDVEDRDPGERPEPHEPGRGGEDRDGAGSSGRQRADQEDAEVRPERGEDRRDPPRPGESPEFGEQAEVS